ncbi:MAG: hypothetical protein ACRYGH_24280 [Janthinobacterium lividum]
MNLFLSKAVGVHEFTDSLQAHFKANEDIEILTKNLVNKFKTTHRLYNIDALEKAIEKPDYALVIINEEY